jgi:hypothetical protein
LMELLLKKVKFRLTIILQSSHSSDKG